MLARARPEQHETCMTGVRGGVSRPRKRAKSTTLYRLPRMLATPRNHGFVSGTGTTLGHRHHLAGVGEPHEPALAAARQAQSRRLDLRGRLGREARRKLLLERAKVEFGGASHGQSRRAVPEGPPPSLGREALRLRGFRSMFSPIAAIFSSSSSRLTGFTM